MADIAQLYNELPQSIKNEIGLGKTWNEPTTPITTIPDVEFEVGGG